MQSGDISSAGKYVLLTAAWNEQTTITRTLDSVVSQTVRPTLWVIVSDGSTDRTNEIVAEYATRYEFIRLVPLADDHPRNFAAQCNAINLGWKYVQGVDFDFIANLDADVSFNSEYFAKLLDYFAHSPKLGLAGGRVEDVGVRRKPKKEDLESVPHTAQMFRRACFEQMGGYMVLPYGGADTHACVVARMNGWEVRLFPELLMHHHRPTSSASGVLVGRVRQGKMDFTLGYHPLFEVARCLRRVRESPVLLGTFARLVGFALGYLRRERPVVSVEYLRCSRFEQKSRLWELLRSRRSIPVSRS